MFVRTALVLAASLAAGTAAQIDRLRATIPGALHQCENTNLVFFDSGGARPLDVLFLPSSEVPASLRSGEVTLDEALALNPLQAIDGIDTPDNDQYSFELQIKQGEVFELFGFLPDGTGKALSLTRTVMTPLPTATNCLRNIQTSIGAGGGQVTMTRASTSSRATATRSSSASRVGSATSSATSARQTNSSASQSGAGTRPGTGSASGSGASNTQIPTSDAAPLRMVAAGALAGVFGAIVQIFLLF
ncbi:hypothetical protein OIV83_006452 [Microbotryomycetes sp. JL201]|nr:hypothetical protein OIV83_006452 [Microbotryomycetes sp. JL201]